MNTNPDPERDDSLLDAVLNDESWQASSAAFKAEALGRFRARQRQRRLARWMGCALALAAVVAGTLHWSGRLAERKIAVNRTEGPKESTNLRFLTDEELLASFPKGSCFFAEIDGHKELVFLDPDVERIYLAKPGHPGNL